MNLIGWYNFDLAINNRFHYNDKRVVWSISCRFVATLLSHFDSDIIDINVTPLLTEYDVVDNN
jgi:hypothetical protein